MIKTAKRAVEEMSETASVEACEATITHSLAFDKNKVAVDWDNDGNPVLVFTTPATETGVPYDVADAVSNWSDQLGLNANDLLGALYDAANTAIAFGALKNMVLK